MPGNVRARGLNGVGESLRGLGRECHYRGERSLARYKEWRQRRGEDDHMLQKLPAPLRKPVGIALGWSFFAFSVLAVPLSVVTLMRWLQISWWLALIGVFVASLIPYAGRFAYFGLSLIGLYYVIDAGFSFSGAVGPFVD